MRARPVLAEFNFEKGVSARGLVAAGRTGRGAFSDLAISQRSRGGRLCSVAALRMRLRATAKRPDNDLGRDQHERELNFPILCGLLYGSVAERSADDSRRATAVAKKVLAFARAVCGCNVDLGGDLGCF